ncbi:MAG: sulfatase/phosphatase domain-containing protein, partial [Planctomycetota bacterium]|nr:sulfatase/phosphatase domain-containing protein [Planctomycetota bacterium]
TPDPEQKLDGISILAQLKKPANKLRKAPLFWHYPLAKPHFLGGHSGGAIRQGPWKLIEWFDTGKVELFNIEEDRGEANNLFAQRKETSEQLLSQLRSWRKELGAKTTTAKE